MLFKVEVKWNYDGEQIEESGIVTGESFTGATRKIENYFGENLETFNMEILTNEDFVTLEKDKRKTSVNLFTNAIKEDYIW